jgi:hypothetical protein
MWCNYNILYSTLGILLRLVTLITIKGRKIQSSFIFSIRINVSYVIIECREFTYFPIPWYAFGSQKTYHILLSSTATVNITYYVGLRIEMTELLLSCVNIFGCNTDRHMNCHFICRLIVNTIH